MTEDHSNCHDMLVHERIKFAINLAQSRQRHIAWDAGKFMFKLAVARGEISPDAIFEGVHVKHNDSLQHTSLTVIINDGWNEKHLSIIIPYMEDIFDGAFITSETYDDFDG